MVRRRRVVTANSPVQAEDGCANRGGRAEQGVFLQRSVVPVLPAIWLFGSALVALMGRPFRQLSLS